MTTEITSIGGKPIAVLTRPHSGKENLAATARSRSAARPRHEPATTHRLSSPARGTRADQKAPPLPEAKRILDEEDNEWGNKVFHMGGALLLPYPNRITGTLSPDGKKIEATVAGKSVSLPANWRGQKPGAQVVSIHGLLLRSQFENVNLQNGSSESRVSADFHAGDFNGHWLSQTDIQVKAVLRDTSFEIEVETKNVGTDLLPMSVAFHPGFIFPSGQRAQVSYTSPLASALW